MMTTNAEAEEALKHAEFALAIGETLVPHIDELRRLVFLHVPPEMLTKARVTMTRDTVHFVDELSDTWTVCHMHAICVGVLQVHTGGDGAHGTLWRERAAVEHYEG